MCPQRLCQTGFLLPFFEKYECYIYYFYPHDFKDTMHPSTQFHIDTSVTYYKWIWLKKTGTKTWQWPHLSPTSLCICLSQNKWPLYWNNCRVIANTTHNVLRKPVLCTFLLFFLTVRLDAASMRRDFLKGKICRSYFSFSWCLLSLY